MFRARRASWSASTPSLSFSFADASGLMEGFHGDLAAAARPGSSGDLADSATIRRKSLIDGSGFIAELKEAAALRRKSLVDFGTPLQVPPLRLHSPKAKEMSIDLANEFPKTNVIVQEAKESQEPGTASQAIVVEDEQTALVHCLQARWHAKKSLISAMRGRASELAEALADARSQGVDSNTLIKAEATLKKRKAAEVRHECEQHTYIQAPTFSAAPDPAKHKAVPISREAQALLDGMMEAQTIISGDFEDLAVPHKSLYPSMQRRRSITAQTINSGDFEVSAAHKSLHPSMQRRRSITGIRGL